MAASSGAEAGAAAAPVPAPVSFGFSRKAERRRVLAAGPCAEPGDGGDGGGGGGDTEFLTAVEGRELLRCAMRMRGPWRRREGILKRRAHAQWRTSD